MSRYLSMGMDKFGPVCYNHAIDYERIGKCMSFSFLPRIVLDDPTQLTPLHLQRRNLRLLMLDFDNTIVPYTTSEPTAEMVAWLENMQKSGIQLCVVSNSHNERVQVFCQRWGLDCITEAGKPSTKGIRECLARYQVPAYQAALMGDQIFTDTLGGNRAGVATILVPPINNHNFWLKARHVLEKPFIHAARFRRIIV